MLFWILLTIFWITNTRLSLAVSEYPNLAGVNTKFATIFFHWHQCDGDKYKQMCEIHYKQGAYKASGFLTPDPIFGWYGEKNYNWVEAQFKDIESAGIDYVLLDTWKIGDSNSICPSLYVMVEHIKRYIRENPQSPLKYGLLVEYGGVKSAYYAAKLLTPPTNDQPLNITSVNDADIVVSIISSWIDKLFGEIPQDRWAISRFSSPYVLFFDYQSHFLTEEAKSNYLPYILSKVNSSFLVKHNKNGLATIVDWEWLYNKIDYVSIYKNYMKKQPWELYGPNYNQNIVSNSQGAFSWSTYGNAQSVATKLLVGNVSPGFNKCNWLFENMGVSLKDCYNLPDGDVNKKFDRQEGKRLEENFIKLNGLAGQAYDLIIFETWGEIGEGTTLQRMPNYPKYNISEGRDYVAECDSFYNTPERDKYCLTEDFYIKKVRSLIDKYGPVKSGPTKIPTSTNNCIKCTVEGDIDCNGVVNINDIYLWHTEYKKTNKVFPNVADLDCDNDVDITDGLNCYLAYRYGL